MIPISSAVDLAAFDTESIRQEGPRIDARISTLLTALLGALASVGGIGGIGGFLSRQKNAYVAMALLLIAAVVLAVGLFMIVQLILPRLTREATPDAKGLTRVVERVVPTRDNTKDANALTQLAAIEDGADARDYYITKAEDPVGYLATQAWSHAQGITGRNRRFRRAGRVLIAGVALATLGSLALAAGW